MNIDLVVRINISVLSNGGYRIHQINNSTFNMFLKRFDHKGIIQKNRIYCDVVWCDQQIPPGIT